MIRSEEKTVIGDNRFPLGVLTVFSRYSHVVHGQRGTLVAFFPAVICN